MGKLGPVYIWDCKLVLLLIVELQFYEFSFINQIIKVNFKQAIRCIIVGDKPEKEARFVVKIRTLQNFINLILSCC